MDTIYIVSGVVVASALVGGAVYMYMKSTEKPARTQNQAPRTTDTFNSYTSPTPSGVPSAGIADPVSLRRNSEFLSVADRLGAPRTGLDRIGEYAGSNPGSTSIFEGQDDLRGFADMGGRFG